MFGPRTLKAVFLLASTLLIRTTSAAISTAIFTAGDFDDGVTPGIIIENKQTTPNGNQSYYFYPNPAGNSGGNFVNVTKYVSVEKGKSAFVSLTVPWKGYIQRGTDELNLNGQANMPMTMVEFQIGTSDGTGGHGDISLEQGYDGPATICSTVTPFVCGGFTKDILVGAPEAALQTKPDGTKGLGTTMGNWASGPNQAAITWEQSQINQTVAYITGGTGTNDIASSNNRFKVTFH